MNDRIRRLDELIPIGRAVPLSRLRDALDAAGQNGAHLRDELEAQSGRYIVFDPPSPGWAQALRRSADCARYMARLEAAGLAPEPHVIRRSVGTASPADSPMVRPSDREPLALLWASLERAWDAAEGRPADRAAVAAAMLEASRLAARLGAPGTPRSAGRHGAAVGVRSAGTTVTHRAG